MENNPILDSDLSGEGGLGLSSEARSYLNEAGRWAKFLSILGFISAGFLVLIGFLMLAFSGFMPPGMGGMGMVSPVLFAVIYWIIAGIQIIPCLYLYNFSAKGQQALRSNDSGFLTESLGNLKSLFKFYGIVAIIVLAFYLLALLIALIAGGAGMMGM